MQEHLTLNMKVFIEEQKFDQLWFKLVMLLTALVIIGSIVLSYSELQNDPTALWVSILVAIISLIIIITVGFLMKLTTKIDENGIEYAFWPIHLKPKQINWKEINDCYVREYRPITEFGGWGYRIKFGQNGKALNVKGNIGIQIVFTNGKKLLIGTQKSEDVKKVLATYKHKF
jgi:hypothetical protein